MHPTLEHVIALSPAIRYVALYRSGQLISQQRDGLTAASDYYEELLVNPTLLTLVRQRGNIDCGGANFIIVGYGKFLQLVINLPGGHVSVCFELGVNPIDFVDAIRTACLTD